MEIELIEIRDFLGNHHPFETLDEDALNSLANAIEIRYARKGEELVTIGKPISCLFLVRTGALETYDPDGNLLARLGEGDMCGLRALLRGGEAINRSVAIEDSLTYCIPVPLFNSLREKYASIDFFLSPLAGGSLAEGKRSAITAQDEGLNLMTIRVGDMLVREPVTITPEATVREAAQKMRDDRASCLLITKEGALAGIFTDRDLRNRVVAEGLPYDTPLANLMSGSPIRIDADAYAFDALLLMSRRNIRHLPVVRGEELAGCITTTNLVKTQTTSAVYLVGDIYKRNSAEEMREVLNHIPDLVLNLADSGATAQNIGHLVSALSDAATSRLITLAEEALGPAPIPYAWMAAGSQARHEQTAQSDQDNWLLLDDSYDPAKHGEYFKAFAKYVNDGLNTCGYIYCPGEMMAMTDDWRQPLSGWRAKFSKWIEQPDPKSLMLSCIFFDLRIIHGEKALFEALHKEVLEKCQKNKIFQAFMAGNAMTHHPPLGFFRNFVLIRGGDHNHTMDLKHNGVVPIVDLARVYALAAGAPHVNTQERLGAARDAGTLSKDGAGDLQDALEYISLIRLRHQAQQIREGKKADNFLEPDALSSFERNHLKDAFTVVKTLQTSMASTYQAGRF
ncbi:MAG: putative nucleotidyltransferase substrate binding domain-containing protein [Rhodospirillaceae bacterium]